MDGEWNPNIGDAVIGARGIDAAITSAFKHPLRDLILS